MNISKDSQGWWVTTNGDNKWPGPYQTSPKIRITEPYTRNPSYQLAVIDFGIEGVLEIYINTRFGEESAVWIPDVDSMLPF